MSTSIPGQPAGRQLRRSAVPAALLASLLVAASCAGANTEAGAPASTVAATQSDDPSNIGAVDDEGTPVTGGSLVVGLASDVPGFDPTSEAFGISASTVAAAIFDPLAAFGPDGRVVPFLAEAFEPNADFTAWDIVLREGVTFSDGTPFDAAAVVAHFERIQGSGTVGIVAQPIETLEVVDPLRARVTLDAPWSGFPSALTTQIGMVGAAAMYESESPTRSPIGTGPFVLEEWSIGERVVVTRNDRYWIPGRPWLDQVTFREIPTPATRLAALDRGEIDLMIAEGGRVVADARRLDGIRLIAYPGALVTSVVMNTAAGPAADPRVRRALVLATDQATASALVTGGESPPANTLWGPTSPWATEPGSYPTFDPDAAEALVAEIEADTGEQISIELTIPGGAGPAADTAQVLVDQWSQVGIDATISPLEGTTAIVALVTGDFDGYVSGRFGRPDPDMEYTFLHSRFVAPDNGFSTNVARFADPDVDAALDASRATQDLEARRDQYQLVSDALAEELPYLYLWYETIGLVASGDIGGLSRLTLPGEEGEAAVVNAQVWVGDVWRS